MCFQARLSAAVQEKSYRGRLRNLCISLESLHCPCSHCRRHWGLSLTGGLQSEKRVLYKQGSHHSNYHCLWQYLLPLDSFHSIQRWHNTQKSRGLFNKLYQLPSALWMEKLPRWGLFPSLLVATGWEEKDKSILFHILGGLRPIPYFGIWGRVFLQEAWQFAWAGGCFSLMNCFAPQQWGLCSKRYSNHCSLLWWACHPP